MLDKLRARAARHPNLTLALIALVALAPFLAKQRSGAAGSEFYTSSTAVTGT